MTTALWIAGVGWVVLLIAALLFAKAADRPGDDFGAVVPLLFCGALSGLLFIAWLGLLIVRCSVN